MTEELKTLLKKAFDEGAMYEATLSKACSFTNFIKDLETEQLLIQLVSNQRELLLAFAEHLFEGHDKDVEARIVDDYLKSK